MTSRSTKHHRKDLKDFSKWRDNAIKLGLLLIVFICAGIVAVRVSHASTLRVSAEAETGTIAGKAGAGPTASASGNASVKFGAASDSCALPNFPNETCTGVPAGTQLTVVTDKLIILDANTVIDGKDLQGCISVAAPGVVIKNSRISCPSDGPVFVTDNGSNIIGDLTIQDSELICNIDGVYGLNGHNVKAKRLNIHGCLEGVSVSDKFSIEDSYIHDPRDNAGATGISLFGKTSTGHIIQHNTVDMNKGLNAIRFLGDIPNSVVSDNLLAGGKYTLSCSATAPSTNVSILNNHFSTKYYPTVGSKTPGEYCDLEAHVTGNVYHETGQPLPLSALH